MSWLKLCLALILIMGGAFAYNISSASYYVEKVHMGTVGGVGNSTDYTSRFTTTYQQPSNKDGVSASYIVNVGWYETNTTYGGVTLTTYIYDPNDGESFGPAACSVVVKVSINTTAPAGSTKNTTCRFYTRQNVNLNWTYNASLSASTTSNNTSVNKTFFNTYTYWLVNCTTTISGVNASTQNVSFTNTGNTADFCTSTGLVVDDSEDAAVYILMFMAFQTGQFVFYRKKQLKKGESDAGRIST